MKACVLASGWTDCHVASVGNSLLSVRGLWLKGSEVSCCVPSNVNVERDVIIRTKEERERER